MAEISHAFACGSNPGNGRCFLHHNAAVAASMVENQKIHLIRCIPQETRHPKQLFQPEKPIKNGVKPLLN